MNTSDFSVVSNDLAAAVQGGKSGAKKGGKKASGEGVDHAHEKGNPPGKFPRLKLVKSNMEATSADQPQPGQTAAGETAQPAVFDSLLAQMERKVLEDAQAQAGASDSASEMRQRDVHSAATDIDHAAPATQDKISGAVTLNPHSFRTGRGRADGGQAAQTSQTVVQLRPQAQATPNSAAPRAASAQTLGFSGQSSGLGKVYAALNNYLNSMPDQNTEPPPAAAAQIAGHHHQPDGKASDDSGADSQDQGAAQKKAEPARPAGDAWFVPSNSNVTTGPQATGPAAVAGQPIAQQITAVLKPEITSLRGSAAPEPGPKVITVHLSPEGLGQLAIRLEKVEGTLKVSLSAQHESTAEHLRSDAATLVTALEGLSPGFSSSDLSFGSMNQQNGDFRQNSNQNGTNSGIAGNEQRSQQQAQEQSGAKPGVPKDASLMPGLPVEQTAAEPRRPGHRPGTIYL